MADEVDFKHKLRLYWCGTWFVPPDFDGDLFARKLAAKSVRFAMQLEACPDTGRPHLQWFAHFEGNRNAKQKGVRLAQVKAIIDKTVHAQPCKGNEWNNSKYTTKSRTWIAGPWTKGLTIEYIGQDLPRRDELSGWQLSLLEVLEQEPEARKIYWIYDY